jgi:hypothetical protein
LGKTEAGEIGFPALAGCLSGAGNRFASFLKNFLAGAVSNNNNWQKAGK